jgi:hypothetical protein
VSSFANGRVRVSIHRTLAHASRTLQPSVTAAEALRRGTVLALPSASATKNPRKDEMTTPTTEPVFGHTRALGDEWLAEHSPSRRCCRSCRSSMPSRIAHRYRRGIRPGRCGFRTNVLATVNVECAAMYRAQGPDHPDLMLGDRTREVSGGAPGGRRPPAPREAKRQVGRGPRGARHHRAGPAGHLPRAGLWQGTRHPRGHGPALRSKRLPPANPRPDQARACPPSSKHRRDPRPVPWATQAMRARRRKSTQPGWQA